ncbi:MAG TPA: hypothetical protein VEJ84_09265 [Acidimicrobiales bacterium]|nr:hypothetical protein [Acidimicrobiales bacterium]
MSVSTALVETVRELAMASMVVALVTPGYAPTTGVSLPLAQQGRGQGPEMARR